jgi:tight adherence protein C
MSLIVLSFVIIFSLIASGGLLLFYRDKLLQRISAVVTPQHARGDLASTLQFTNVSLTSMVGKFDNLLPKSNEEISVVQQRMIRAGFRKESSIKIFYGAKILTPLSLCSLAAISGFGSRNPFFAYALALGFGYLIPDFWLGRKISTRQKHIRLGLPDALDLLVICIEAGLGMDQATARTAKELRLAQPAISDELGIVVLEQRAGRARSDAWKQFATRTDVDSVRNLVSVLVQSEQLGTSVAKTLRTHSDTLRTQRRQRVEEQAAKTTVKLVFPLVFFIFPSLFVVTVGPAIIIMMESFKKYLT